MVKKYNYFNAFHLKIYGLLTAKNKILFRNLQEDL